MRFAALGRYFSTNILMALLHCLLVCIVSEKNCAIKRGVGVKICNSSTWAREAGGSKFKASFNCTPSLRFLVEADYPALPAWPFSRG